MSVFYSGIGATCALTPNFASKILLSFYRGPWGGMGADGSEAKLNRVAVGPQDKPQDRLQDRPLRGRYPSGAKAEVTRYNLRSVQSS